MTMIEHIVSIVVAALLLQGSYESWKRFKEWKNDEGRKQRRETRKHESQLRRELLDLGIPKEEL